MRSMRCWFGVILLLAIIMSVMPATAAVRTVLMEGFTQWNCGPCAGWNPTEAIVLNALTRDTVVAIKYHVSWPAPDNDAFYHWNTTESAARWGYYGVSGVPDGYIDGRTSMTRTQTGFRNQIRTRRNVAAPCEISVVATARGPRQVHFSATIDATDSALTNTRAFAVLITDHVTYASAPGSNGERTFPEIFRDLYPSASGQTITSIPLGGSFLFEGDLNKDSSWVPDSLAVVVFLQDNASKWVHQAGWAQVSNLWSVRTTTEEPRQAIVSKTGELTYAILMENMGQNDDEYTVSITGGLPAGWTQSIEATGIPGNPSSIQVPLTSGSQSLVALHLNPNGNGGNANVGVLIESNNDTNTVTRKMFHIMAGVDVLLVDDDSGPSAGDMENYYISSLANTQTGRNFGSWDLQVSALTGEHMNAVPAVVWMTGSSFAGHTLEPENITLLQSYMDNGGNVFLTGQGISWDLRSTTFLADYFHARHVQPNPNGRTVVGVSDDPVARDLNFSLTGGDGADNQTRQSAIRADDDGLGTVCFEYSNGGLHAGVRSETTDNRTLFLAFGFESIDTQENRDSVMARAVHYLLYGSTAIDDPIGGITPNEYTLGQNYPNPFNPETVIPYSLASRSSVTLRVFDVLGREVAVLASGTQEAGRHVARWNASELSSGIYFYQLEAVGSKTSAPRANWC